jgi:hypothetical protein
VWPYLLLQGDSGEEIRLYDPNDPRKSVKAELQDHDFRAEDATLLMGLGLGYHAEAISKRMETDHQLIVIEPSLEVFQVALKTVDLRPLLENDRVHLFAGPAPEGLYEAMEYHLMRIVAGSLKELTLTPLAQAFPGPYGEAEDRARKIRTHLVLSYRFNLGNDSLLSNLLENAAHLPVCGDTGSLSGVLSGTPAIVIAGGPSLSRNIHALKEAQGRACLICVDTALKPLLASGIEPDLVVAADPFPQNARKVEGLTDLGGLPLLFDIGVHSSIPRAFDGPRFVTSNQNGLARWLVNLSGFQEDSDRTTSAAHLAFHAARWMEADPIVFAGLDLAFPEGAHHVEGAAYTWSPPEDSPFVEVPDVFGGTVKTVPGFQAMIGLFEMEIAAAWERCIDATEGGARIQGTELMDLADAIRGFGPSADPAPRARLEKAFSKPSDGQMAALEEGLERLLRETRATLDASREALPLLEQAQDLLFKGRISAPEFQQTASRILELDRDLGRQALFDRVLIDFRAELLAFQFLQAYRIRRETRQTQNLALTLESIEHSFQDAYTLSDRVVSALQELTDGLSGRPRNGASVPQPGPAAHSEPGGEHGSASEGRRP